jgi:hypothetical protein
LEASDQLAAALRLLQPAFLRVGGSLQDLVTHAGAAGDGDCDVNLAGDWAPRGLRRIGYERGGCYTNADVDKVDGLAVAAGASTIWGVGFPADGRTKTSAASARRLLFHLRSRQQRNESSVAALTYGNELCGAKGLAARVPVAAYAAQWRSLVALVDSLWGAEDARGREPPEARLGKRGVRRPLLAAPDCGLDDETLGWVAAFAASAGPALDAVGFHAYWLGPGANQAMIEQKLLWHTTDKAQASRDG